MKALLIFFALLFIAACATSPTGRKQLILMPANQMDAMGVQAFTDMKKKTPADSTPADNTYVKCIANALTHEIEGEYGKRTWEVVVFQDDTVNAFALPGGKIGVLTGIFKTAKNQDQLAAVIGHEVGHVIAQHGNERVSQSLGVEAGMLAADAVLQHKENPNRGLIMAGIGVGAQYGVLMPFSRTQESEADLIGLDMMARAGFNPQESIILWKNMNALGGQPPEWLSDHPSNDKRISQLQAHMGSALSKYHAAQATGKRPNCVR